MSTPPREFFEHYVKRSFAEFSANQHEEYRAKMAAINADIMADRMWHHYKGTQRVYGAETESLYRDALTKLECVDFGLIRDVAESFKHYVLTRRAIKRLVTSAQQTGAKPIVFKNDNGRDVTFINASGEPINFQATILIELNDGTVRALLSSLEAVVAMWDRLSEP